MTFLDALALNFFVWFGVLHALHTWGVI